MKRPYTLGLYEKSMPSQLGWKEKLEAAKGAGFDFVEISIDETEEKLGRLDMSEEPDEGSRASHTHYVSQRTPQVSAGKQRSCCPQPRNGDYGESNPASR